MITSTLTFIALCLVVFFIGAATIGFWITFFILAFGLAAVIAVIAVVTTCCRGIFSARRRAGRFG